MKDKAGPRGIQGSVIAVAVVAAAIAVGLYFFRVASIIDMPGGAPQTVVEVPEAKVVPSAAEPVPVAARPDPLTESEPEVKVVAPVPVAPPGFDLVRVEADGAATVAGRAVPGALVAILLDGVEIESLAAGSDGSFAGFVQLGLADRPRAMSLSMETADGTTVVSTDQVIVAASVGSEPKQVPLAKPAVEATKTAVAAVKKVPTPAPAPAPAPGDEIVSVVDATVVESLPRVEAAVAQAPETAPPSADGAVTAPANAPGAEAVPQAVAAVDRAPEPAPAEVAVAAEESEPTPVLEPVEVVAADPQTIPTPSRTAQATQDHPVPDGTEANQAAVEPAPAPSPEPARAPAVLLAGEDGVRVLQPAGPQVMDSVALDTISYSDQGEVQLAGRAQGSGYVRVYLDNAPITTSRIEADGNWRTGLPDVDTGIYTLRVDEIDADGKVTSRVETPFKREAKALVDEAELVRSVTVQPGSTLWAIARANYGKGTLYVRLFQANRDRIRNPDLIYPGQVFDIPRD